MEAYILQEIDHLLIHGTIDGQNLIEAYRQQQDEYLRNSARFVEELDREMSIMLSTHSIHQHEYYLNHNYDFMEYLDCNYDFMDVAIENNFMDEHQTKMIENNLKTKTHHVNKGEDSDVCSICLDDFKEGSCVGVLDCPHQFHSNCLKNWLVINNVCPLCKSTGVRQRS